jgi:hypothetical protein
VNALRARSAPLRRAISSMHFILSAALTSVAGALYAVMFGFVDPDSGLGILVSVKMVIMAALGGAGLLFGPLIGAAVLVPLEASSRHTVPFAHVGKSCSLIAEPPAGRPEVSLFQRRRWCQRQASIPKSIDIPVCGRRHR